MALPDSPMKRRMIADYSLVSETALRNASVSAMGNRAGRCYSDPGLNLRHDHVGINVGAPPGLSVESAMQPAMSDLRKVIDRQGKCDNDIQGLMVDRKVHRIMPMR